MKTVSLDLHDWSIHNNRLDLLLKIKEHYPDFKVSLFTIPVHAAFEMTPENRVLREKRLELIHQNLDWLQIIPHGLTHIPREFEKCDYYTMRDLVLPSVDEAFKKDKLPYVKGWCSPYWLSSPDVIRVLNEKGWWLALDRNQPNMEKANKNYIYSHSLEEPFWLSTNDTIKLHGHVDGQSANDLEACFTNIFKLPADVKWAFVTDFVE